MNSTTHNHPSSNLLNLAATHEYSPEYDLSDTDRTHPQLTLDQRISVPLSYQARRRTEDRGISETSQHHHAR